MSKKKILFVCEGNLCRSPLAQAIFQRYIEENSLENQFLVESSGMVKDLEGCDYHPYVMDICNREGMHLKGKSRMTRAEDIKNYDYVFAMDSSVLQKLIDLVAHNKRLKQKIYLLGKFISPEDSEEIPDPMGKELQDFEHIYELLLEKCSQLLEALS